jgi:putative molybdopterin biosynthesis protein
MSRQEQFLQVLDRDEAERRFTAALQPRPLGEESVPLNQALGRVLSQDVAAPVDVPGFDRSNVDGFAVRSVDTFGASEDQPISLQLGAEAISPGRKPMGTLMPGIALEIATGAMLPRGADAVVMVEHTEVVDETLRIHRPVTPGANASFAGTDMGRGETVLWAGTLLTSRETGVLAALGLAQVQVWRKPRVAILSTGDELLAPGEPLQAGQVYDSNATMLADAVRELGGAPVLLGIVPDDAAQLRHHLREALAADVVLLSGGTSKGAGDLTYRVVAELGPPGILVHGVALKPGKPLCLAAIDTADQRRVPVVILPGFPTSAIFTFHEFVAPLLRKMAGRTEDKGYMVEARLPFRVNSERGRTEYLLVHLLQETPQPLSPKGRGEIELLAYPTGKGSGSVTAFSKADGFLTIPRQQEYLEAGETVQVRLLGQAVQPADLIVIGSHCLGLDFLLGQMQRQGWRCKAIAVGSTAGLQAVQCGACDVAGIHLLDPATNLYNSPFLTAEMELLPGYGRMQGIVVRMEDARFQGATSAAEALALALAQPDLVMMNRNRGSGTRLLLDRMLQGKRPAGYWAEGHSHNAVAAAIVQGRADWGLCIATVATTAGLRFFPVQEERFDFVLPRSRWERPAVQTFRQLLTQEKTQQRLRELGFLLVNG